MSDQHINNKPTKVGDTVTYTGQDSRKHKATIKSLTGDRANLEATVDGQTRQFTSVAHNTQGTPNSWDHAN